MGTFPAVSTKYFGLRNAGANYGFVMIGNSLSGSAWGQKLYPAFACAEMKYGNGKIIINEVDLDSHLSNPVARIFKNRLMRY